MWFGDLVTMAWWDDLWLNESFADWICVKLTGQVHPEFRLALQQVTDSQVAMRSDGQPSVLPVRRKISGGDDPEQFVDELTYNKGKAVLEMVENWITPEVFRAAMRTYFIKHRWGNTTSADLWAAFDEASSKDISAMLAGFIEQPGLPVVNFSLTPDGQLHLAQQRFTNLGGTPPAQLWQVPVCFTWSAHGQLHRERVLLDTAGKTVAIPGLADADWIYPNTGEHGYYRWTLPAALNARLASRAAAVLTPGERIGLLDNVSALLDAGQLAGGDFLAYLAAFAGDPEPEVTLKVIAGLDKVKMAFLSPGHYEKFHAFTQALLQPALARIGVTPAPDEPDYYAPLRNALYAQLGTDIAEPTVIAAARATTAKFLAAPSSVDASLARFSLGVAAYHGDSSFFGQICAGLENSKTPNARANYLSALGDFHDRTLVDRALAYSLTPALNSTEFLRVARGVSADPDHRRRMVGWVMANFDTIKAKAPPQYLAGLIYFADGGEPELYATLKKFLLNPARTSQSAVANAVKVGDHVALRSQLRERELANIEAFLATYPHQTPADRAK